MFFSMPAFFNFPLNKISYQWFNADFSFAWPTYGHCLKLKIKYTLTSVDYDAHHSEDENLYETADTLGQNDEHRVQCDHAQTGRQ